MKTLSSLAALCVLVIAGCASGPAPLTTAETTQTLNQYHWQLVRAHDKSGQHINALFVRPDKPLALEFQDGHVHVANACNILNGSYTIDGDQLVVKQMISTMMACMDPAVSALDKAMSSRLEHANTFALDASTTAPSLTLITPDKDTLVFRGSPHDQ